ncbi:hypothetical protein [Clostridium perfringens]|nr:hypothetical protein [Clostridium perfringens]MBI6055116.1 hypothetical protein [Clostridium perfringens]MBO3324950.1 hypothetical protein [Clostridium perfringens]MDT7916926.1 hypothetical protein [Clostridium perfringens]MDT7936142.1 hypothetical protein [Clostridium perfringens]MDT7939288.1 hypothetical protein [Clostridium perfringens]
MLKRKIRDLFNTEDKLIAMLFYTNVLSLLLLGLKNNIFTVCFAIFNIFLFVLSLVLLKHKNNTEEDIELIQTINLEKEDLEKQLKEHKEFIKYIEKSNAENLNKMLDLQLENKKILEEFEKMKKEWSKERGIER